MANLVTESDIRKLAGLAKVILPAGSILTPSAKDWAAGCHMEIQYGETPKAEDSSGVEDGKALFLKKAAGTVVRQMRQHGAEFKAEELESVAIACLERLGCQIKP